MQLRVLHVLSDTNIGGAGSYLLNLLTHYDPAVLDIFVLIPPQAALLPHYRKTAARIITSTALPADRSFSLSHLVAGIKEIRELIKKHKIDIVHTHASFMARLAARVAGVPVVYTRHRLDQPRRPGWRRLANWLNNCTCDRAVAVSRAAAEVLKEEGIDPGKIVIIPNGIDVTAWRRAAFATRVSWPAAAAGRRKVGMVARLEKEKDPFTFLRMAEEILAERQDVYFVVVGEGALAAALAEYIKKRNLVEHVWLAGLRQDVAALMADLDVLVHPARSEAFGLVLVEAMALGKPCVAVATGGVPEVVADGVTGFLVAEGDYRAMAARVCQLLMDESFRSRIGEAALRRVEEEFKVEQMLERLLSLYEHLALVKNKKVV